MSNTRQTVSDLLEAYPRIDGLVLCARFFRTYRSVTSEGFEDNFALFYLSRALLSYGLLPSFDKSDGAVIINAAGPGHDTPIDWDDLQSARNYDGVRAMFMTGRLNDLHGVTFAERHADRASYVLFHPGTTSTGFVGEFDRPTAAYIEQQKLLSKPATDVVPPILRLLDDPPKEPLSAFNMYNELSIRSPLFSCGIGGSPRGHHRATAGRRREIAAYRQDGQARPRGEHGAGFSPQRNRAAIFEAATRTVTSSGSLAYISGLCSAYLLSVYLTASSSMRSMLPSLSNRAVPLITA